MDNKRLIAFFVLTFALILGWGKYFAKPAPRPQTDVTQAAAATPAVLVADDKLQYGQRIKVNTDLVAAEIDTVGADLRSLKLLKHGEYNDPKQPLTLLQDSNGHDYVAQTGLYFANIAHLPDHHTVFTSPQHEVMLAPGQNSVEVRLDAPVVDGVHVTKVYTFKRNSYLIDVRYEIANGGTVALTTSIGYRLRRDGSVPAGSTGRLGGGSFTGLATYTADTKFRKLSFKDIDEAIKKDDGNGIADHTQGALKDKYASEGHDGWVAIMQHYFFSAWLLSPYNADQATTTGKLVPGDNVCVQLGCQYHIGPLANSSDYVADAIVNLPAIAPGTSKSVSVPLYVGPTDTHALDVAAPGLDLVRNVNSIALLAPLARPLFWALDHVHSVVGNWGWAIVVLTILIKICFYPLASTSYRSMAKMKKLAPRQARLKEQFADDPMKFREAVMKLYKEEKVNPLGGCLPLLLQIPVFMAFYSALGSAVELRQAPWILWIHDLSMADPYYVLPLLMAASMYGQSFLNPSTGDPMQDKMQKIMPLAFSFLFFALPSGLVLYQVTNSILSITQQWYITRIVGRNATVPVKA